MKNYQILFLLFLLLTGVAAQAQQPETDQLETKKGAVKIQPVNHGALVLHWDNKTIWVDPYGGANLYEGIAAPDLILITDIHQDHLDLKTLGEINTAKAKIIAPQAVAEQLPENLKTKTTVLANGDKSNLLSVSVTAVPMYNLPETADSRHPKGRGNGYILEMGGKRIYISGDTGDIKEMRELKNIDVAFVCMNLPYTMSVDQAASAVLAFKPKVVYPYHFRGQDGLSDVEIFRKKVNAKDRNIEVRLRNWYPEKE